jgi:hypothetical protein
MYHSIFGDGFYFRLYIIICILMPHLSIRVGYIFSSSMADDAEVIRSIKNKETTQKAER